MKHRQTESSDQASLRQAVIDEIADKAERELNDTRYNWLRSLQRRRLLVILSFCLVAVYTVPVYFEWVFVTLPALLAYLGCLWLPRVAVRGITEFPDELVDERMRQKRGHTYRLAFVGSITFMSLYLCLYIGNQVMAKAGWVLPLTADQLHGMAFVMIFASIILPSSIYAWTEPEL